MPSVSIAGSTGSIGRQTLEVIDRDGDTFAVVALAAGHASDLLLEQVQRFEPELVSVANAGEADALRTRVDSSVRVVHGEEGLCELAAMGDTCVNGVVGFAGLPVTLSALEAGRRLALANKESLIAAGPVVRRVLEAGGGEILPVDSEHAAIHQCLHGAQAGRSVAKLWLTASGGPFRETPAAQLEEVSVADALAHPTWSMGAKITVDSSTLMNKGLEVLEARELFGVPLHHISVVVHPQSIVHSMVEFTDGSTLAQLSEPDMRLPISYALHFPERGSLPFSPLDLTKATELSFEPPDRSRFRCLDLAYAAGNAGPAGPAWVSAANEVAVEAFLAGRIGWVQIAELIELALDQVPDRELEVLGDVVAVDAEAREVTGHLLANLST